MSDFLQTMTPRPTRLYRKTGALEFLDKNGVVYATGQEPPPDYRLQAVRQPLAGPREEVYVLRGEYE